MGERALTVDGARWSCKTCGQGCRSFSLGPVDPNTLQGLIDADIERLWPPAAAGPWHHIRKGPDGTEAAFLAHRGDGGCVFLREDDLCAVHDLLGADAKPWFCREYPFHVVETSQGLTVTVRADCAKLHETWADGELVEDQVDEVLAYGRTLPRPRFAPETVVILPGLGVSADNWLAIEPSLLALLRAPRPPSAQLATARDHLTRLAGRPLPPPDPSRHTQALRAGLAGFAHGFAAARDQTPPQFQPMLDAAAEVLGQASDAEDSDLPPLDDDALAYLSVVLRSEILGKRFETVGTLPAGLGLFLLEVHLARLAAGKASVHRPADIGPHLSDWKRVEAVPALWGQIRGMRPLLESLFVDAE